MIARKGAWLGGLLLAAVMPLAQAATCNVDMGQGWPVAMGNYGQGAAELLGGVHGQGLALLLLPRRGEESQLVLAPDADGQWMVRHARAQRRIHYISNDSRTFGVQLRFDQEPDIDQAPIPESLALRVIDRWQAALANAGMAERAPMMDNEQVVSVAINGQRYSGRTPACGPLYRLLDSSVLLQELAASKEKKHERRHEAIAKALDKYDERLAGAAGEQGDENGDH